MANLRFDKLAMSRAAQAAGDVNAVLLKQEVAPEDILAVTRRTGTIRQDYYTNSLGAMIVGKDKRSCWYPSTHLDRPDQNSWSVGCSVKFGQLHWVTADYGLDTATAQPLITVRSLTTPGNSFELFTAGMGADTRLKMKCTVAGGSPVSVYSGTGAVRALGSTDSLVFEWDHSNEILRVKTKGGTTDAEVISLDCTSLATQPNEKYVVELLGYGGVAADKESHTEHVISNATIYTAYLDDSAIAALHEDRTPAVSNLKHHFKLNEGGKVALDSKGSSPHVLFSDPSAPEVVSNSYLFNGRTSALRVQLTSELQNFYISTGNNNPRVGFSGFIKFTPLQDPSIGEQILVDAGGWFQVKVTTAGRITLTMPANTESDGSTPYFETTTSSHHAAIVAGTEYTVFFGVFVTGSPFSTIRVDTAAATGTQKTTGFLGSTYNSPELDFGSPPKVYVGAEASETATTNLGAAVARFALYREWLNEDIGVNRESILYLTGDEFKDKTVQNVAVWPLIHSSVSSTPTYTLGPLEDGLHVGVAGGHVLGEAGVVGLTRGVQRLSRQLKSDADTLRIGSKLLIASNSVGHIVDEQAETVRPYGVPAPARNVSVRASAPGVLHGAASYGYRYVTADGTYGPMERTDPAAITGGLAGRFIVGSDAGGGSEFCETAGKTNINTAESMQAHTATTNPFTAGDDICIEVAAKLEEFDAAESNELVWDRGFKGVDTNGVTPPTHQAYRTETQGSSIVDVNDDFSVQVSFKYDATRSNTNGKSDIGVFGIGGGTTVNNNATANMPNISAWISTGRDRIKTNHSNNTWNYFDGWGTTGTTVDTVEGAGRLVIGLSRNSQTYEYRNRHNGGSSGYSDTYDKSGYNMPWANWKPITFSNDANMWVDGHDYSLFVVRSGTSLSVYVHDATRGTFTTLTATDMVAQDARDNAGARASGQFCPAISAYNGSDFFQTWTAPIGSSRVSVNSINWAACNTPFMKADGQMSVNWADFHGSPGNLGGDAPAQTGPLIGGYHNNSASVWLPIVCAYPMREAEGNPFHFRVWGRAYSKSVLESFGHYRNAGRPGHQLDLDIKMDTYMFFEDLAYEANTFTDQQSPAIVWKPYNITSTSTTVTDEIMTFTQTVSYGDTKQQPILIIGEIDDHDMEDAPLALYYTSKGDGSIVLQTHEPGANGLGTVGYTLAHSLSAGAGTDPQLNKIFADYEATVNEFDEWNMFSIGIKIGTAGEFILTGLAINGNMIFTQQVSRDVAPVETYNSTNWITLGGHTNTSPNNRTTTYIGEFRIWENGKGPSKFFTDIHGAAFWKVNDRLSISEAADTHIYYQFQSTDSGGAVNYGDLNAASVLALDSGVTIYDERTAAGDAVAFPLPPRDDIVALEVFRTQTRAIPPGDLESDTQDALDAVRYAPLYFVRRLLAGTKSFIDDTPDPVLGFAAPYTAYSLPEDIKQFFTWQGMLGVLGENNRIYYTEPGPYGWETFPTSLTYEARISGGGAGDLLACRSTGDTLYLFGSNWTTALVGSPGNETEFSFGGGIGAHSPRATIDITGVVYAFNGRLWTIDRVGQVDFKIQDIGVTFQDILPTHSNVRLSCSATLQSLFILDENTGDTIRLFLPTGEATVEKRDAVAITDSSAGEDLWVNLGGSYSKGSSTVYGDDVDSDTTTHSAGTLVTSSSRFDCSTTLAGINLGMRVGIVDASGNTIDTRVTGVAGNNVTVASVAGLGNNAAGTIYFGVSSEGMLIDSGYIDSQDSNTVTSGANVSLHQGSGVEVGISASPVIGSRASIADAQFVAVSTNEVVVGADMRGRFVRAILRNRVPENTALSYIDLELNSTNEK